VLSSRLEREGVKHTVISVLVNLIAPIRLLGDSNIHIHYNDTKESTKCNGKSANAATSCQFTLGALTEQSIAFKLEPNVFFCEIVTIFKSN